MPQAPATRICPLEKLGLIRLSGEDAATLLQGQSTCDIHAIMPDIGGCGAFCTPQGRVIANFRITRQQGDFYLWLLRDLAETVCRRLRLYVLRSRVTVENLSEQFVLFGGFGMRPDESFEAIMHPIGDSQERTLLAMDRTNSEALAALSQDWGTVSSTIWEIADIEAGWPWISAALTEAFIPQMLNLDQMGGVSFKKGCYTGQEIVTRTRFLGQVKRRLYRLSGDGTQLPCPGDAISLAGVPDCPPIGQVITAAQDESGDHFQMLAVLSVEHAEDPGRLLVTQDESTRLLKRESLPYSLA